MEEHRERGADVEVDVSCMYLRFFEEDDAKYKDVLDKYGRGDMLTGEVKQHLITVNWGGVQALSLGLCLSLGGGVVTQFGAFFIFVLELVLLL